MSTTATTPAAVIKDAVATFLQQVNHALASSEEVTKTALSHAVENERLAQRERDQLRHERDAIIQERSDALLLAEGAKRETERWKAATEKAEWTIDHQTETIAQLRREAQDWKVQFMRVEEERSRLSARIDELVSEQLYANRREAYFPEPLTPRSQGPQALSSSSSTSNRGTSSNYFSTNTLPGEPTISTHTTSVDATKLASSRHPSRGQISSTQASRVKASRKPRPPAAGQSNPNTPFPPIEAPLEYQPSLQKQTLIRRVHAVLEAPVKEESVDADELFASEEESRSLSLGAQGGAMIQQRGNGKRRAAVEGEAYRRQNKGDPGYEDNEEDVDELEEEDERYVSGSDADEYAPNTRKDDEEEDELMMGVEDNRNELYGSERVLVTSGARTPTSRGQTQPSPAKHASSSGKKRNSPYPITNTNKKGRRR